MLRTISLTGSLVLLQLLMDIADNGEINGGDKTKLLSTFFVFKKLFGADYLIFITKKAFNHL